MDSKYYSLHEDTDNPLRCSGYVGNRFKKIGYVVLCVLTLGLLWLVCRWLPRLWLLLTHTESSILDAAIILIEDSKGDRCITDVKIIDIHSKLRKYDTFDKGPETDGETKVIDDEEDVEDGGDGDGDDDDNDEDTLDFVNTKNYDGGGSGCGGGSGGGLGGDRGGITDACVKYLRYFDHQHTRYVWNRRTKAFEKLNGLKESLTCGEVWRTHGLGYSNERRRFKRKIYGPNELDIEVKSYFRILIEEALNPFYIFQLFSVIVWVLEEYYTFSGCIVIISILSLTVQVVESRKQRRTLKNTITTEHVNIRVVRSKNGDDDVQTTEISSRDLVPGDVIYIDPPHFYQQRHDEHHHHHQDSLPPLPPLPPHLHRPPQHHQDDPIGDQYHQQQHPPPHHHHHHFFMPCDVMLVDGSVVVDEGMLTGESIPVTKQQIPSDASSSSSSPSSSSSSSSSPPSSSSSSSPPYYSPSCHKHIVFCGTKVLQVRCHGDRQVKAVVVKTGFSTTKGELVRSILYPKPLDMSFYADVFKFLFFLAVLAMMGMVYTFTILTVFKDSIFDKIITSLDIVTIAVPPALPAALTVGVIYAQSRLRGRNIFCTNPQSINLSAAVDCCCFDKTGTLTEEGLDFWGVVAIDDDDVSRKSFKEPIKSTEDLSNDSPLVVAMATCHSLIVIGGEISGDPMDVKMFESVDWEINENNDSDQAGYTTIIRPQNSLVTDGLVVLRQFQFESSLQRMSVVVKMRSTNEISVYIKGAPEIIRTLCQSESIPTDFEDTLKDYTSKGLRVIAMATRLLDESYKWQNAKRTEIETSLRFLGLLIFENRLKPETKPVLGELKSVNIRTVMITGDNAQTALCVARNCGMLAKGQKVIRVEATPPPLHSPPHRGNGNVGNGNDDVTKNEDDDDGRSRDGACVRWFVDEEVVSKRRSSYYRGESMGRNDKGLDTLISIALESNTSDDDDDDDRGGDDDDGGGDASYSFVIDGRSYDVIVNFFPNLIPKIMTKTTLFARMTPNQKASVVENLKSLGYTVCMCGDGANDCTALKTAHVGVSLSQLEASVAATFTYRLMDISCVPIIIKEGKGSLMTSFGMFNFMALYSIVQYSSFIILIIWMKKLGNSMFLYIDLFITTLLALTMGRTHPSDSLTKKRPPNRLASPGNMIGLLGHVTIQVAFQLAALMYLKHQSWYKPDMDATCIFYVSIFQYMSFSFAFNLGYHFKRPFWTNTLFMVTLISLAALSTVFVFDPWRISYYLFDSVWIGDNFFRLMMVNFIIVNVMCTQLLQIIIRSEIYHKTCATISCQTTKRPQYKLISQQLNDDSDWPPISQVT